MRHAHCRYHSTGYIGVSRAEFLQRKADSAERRRLAALPPKIECAAPANPQGPLMQVGPAYG